MDEVLTQIQEKMRCTRPAAQGYIELANILREMVETRPLAWAALRHHTLLWYETTMMASIHATTEQVKWESLGEARKTEQVLAFLQGILNEVEGIRNPPEEPKPVQYDL